MKLKDLLSNKSLIITYRTIHPEYGDLYAGSCKWDGKILIPNDGDDYSVEDEITNYKYTSKQDILPDELTVWYTSRWITE